MANAVAEDVREAGPHVDIKRGLRRSRRSRSLPTPTPSSSARVPVFGGRSSQMANFLNQAGGLWARGALHGKVGGAPQQLLRQRRIRFRQKMKRFSRPLRTAKCLTGDSI